MNKCTFVIALLILLTLSACETSRSYYGKTSRSASLNQSLYRLDLSKQDLQHLPEEVALQHTLRTVNLSHNPNLELEGALEVLCSLPHLHVLLLNHLQLTSLPANIAQCQHLTHVSLSGNPALNLPDALSHLGQLELEFLNLSDNALTSLPENLSRLKTLRDIRLSHNHLVEPESYKILASLPKLFSLWLDNNRLRQLPDNIGLLKQVGYLYLDHNYLAVLPQSMRRMGYLSAIWLGHNCFEHIPTVLADKGIFMAFLNNNRITDIGDRFRDKPFFFRGIILDYNYLSQAQREEARKIFHDTFIYSDDNQLPVSALPTCSDRPF